MCKGGVKAMRKHDEKLLRGDLSGANKAMRGMLGLSKKDRESLGAPPPAPTILGVADQARAMNPLDVLPSTLLSGAEYDAVQKSNAAKSKMVLLGSQEDARNVRTQETANLAEERRKLFTLKKSAGREAAFEALAKKKSDMNLAALSVTSRAARGEM
jgi:hypothetical protein